MCGIKSLILVAVTPFRKSYLMLIGKTDEVFFPMKKKLMVLICACEITLHWFNFENHKP